MKALQIVFLFLTLAASISKGDPFFDEVAAGMKVVWAVPANTWPPTNKIWSYKVVPQHFSDAAISNLMILGSFTEKDKTGFGYGSLGTKYLKINPTLGYIEYYDEKAIASPTSAITNVPEPVIGVPDKEESLRLGLKYLHLAGIDTSQLLNPRWYTETRGWINQKTHTEVDEVQMRAVDFERRIDGLVADGAGIAYVGFGNNAKVANLKISWRGLEPYKSLDNLVTPKQIVQLLQIGKIPFLPRVRTVWTFGKVKTLTITSVSAYYQMRPGEEPMDFVTPTLQFNALMNNGTTNWPIGFRTGIFQ